MTAIQPRTREAVLKIAAWQLGVLESPAGSNAVKYNEAYRPGDILLFDFSGRRGKTEHAGILERVETDGTLVTIEGNTGTGNDANGGAVQRRRRKPGLVTGACRPRYNLS